MATPPTFVAEVEGPDWTTSTTPKTTGGINGALGDVLVSVLGDEGTEGTEDYAWSSSPAETWTERSQSTGGVGADAFAQAATAILSAARTGLTISAARAAGTASIYNHTVAQFTGSDGVGNAAASGHLTGAPSWSFTTNFDNSAIVVIFADWQAVDGATRVWRTVNGFTPTLGNGLELTYVKVGTNLTVYVAYYPDAGAAGAKTLGLSAPAGQTAVAAAVEVRGTAGAGPVEAGHHFWKRLSPRHVLRYRSPKLIPFQLLGSREVAAGVTPVALADTGSGADVLSVTVAAPSADTAAGSDALAVTAAVSVADTGSGSDVLAVSAAASLADTGTGTDVLSVDVGSTPKSLPDTASGTDALTVSVAVPLADTGVGADGLTVAAAVTLADTGSGADALVVSVPITLTDTGAGIDSLSAPSAAVPLADPRTATDALTATATVPLTDTGTGTDTLSVAGASNPSLPDTATGTDVLTVTAAVPLPQTATGTDVVSVGGSANKSLPETATGSDALTVTVTLSAADTGTGADAITVARAATPAETASAVDALFVAVSVILSDAALAFDALDRQDNSITGRVTAEAGTDHYHTTTGADRYTATAGTDRYAVRSGR